MQFASFLGFRLLFIIFFFHLILYFFCFIAFYDFSTIIILYIQSVLFPCPIHLDIFFFFAFMVLVLFRGELAVTLL